MAGPLHNCCYDKAKLLHELSCSTWFIEKHALNNASQAGDNELQTALSSLKNDLKKHVDVLHQLKCNHK